VHDEADRPRQPCARLQLPEPAVRSRHCMYSLIALLDDMVQGLLQLRTAPDPIQWSPQCDKMQGSKFL